MTGGYGDTVKRQEVKLVAQAGKGTDVDKKVLCPTIWQWCLCGIVVRAGRALEVLNK